MNFEVFNMQVLSPYILRKKSETGELFFNSKNNHSFSLQMIYKMLWKMI